MAIVKMKKLSLTVHQSVRESVLKELQKLECLHLDSMTKEDDGVRDEKEILLSRIAVDIQNTEETLTELEDVIGFLLEQNPPKELGIIDQLAFMPPAATFQSIEEIYTQFDLEMNIRGVRTIEKRFKETEVRLNTLLKEKEELEAWKNAAIDLDIVNHRNELLDGFTGYLPATELSILKAEIEKHTPYTEAFEAYSTDKDTYIFVVTIKSESEKTLNTLKEMGFNQTTVSARTGTAEQALAAIDEAIARISSSMQAFRIMIFDYSEYLDVFKSIYDYLYIQKTQGDAEKLGTSSAQVNFFTGWFPARDEKRLKATLDKYPAAEYSFEEPKPEEYEEVPVLLENPMVFKPFEMLTKMYGTPMYGRSIDPTVHLSPFYFIFYGFCLSDFFYGLLQFLIFGYIAIRARKNPDTSRFMSLLALAGISTMFFGIIFGSYFGDLFTNYLKLDVFAVFVKSTLLIDPIKSPMFILYIALIMGAIHLLYGVTLNMIKSMKESVADALWNGVPWLVLLTGGFGWGVFSWIASMAPEAPKMPAEFPSVALMVAAVGAVLIVLSVIRAGKKTIGGIIGSFFGGLYKLYGATSFISDLLSFARLLALGLSTGVIASVFNQLSFGVIGALPQPVGWIVGFVMLVFFHTFDLVLSSFGAFIHSLRLQYVEFFSKFMESGGKEYKPLTQQGIYYTMKN